MSNRAERRRAHKASLKNQRDLRAPKMDDLKSKPLLASDLLKSCAFMDAEGVIHHGFKSHWELRASIGREDPAKALPTDVPGFWTVDDQFVTRREAAALIGWVAGRELLSSDVW